MANILDNFDSTVDSRINDKTADYSIAKQDVGNTIKEGIALASLFPLANIDLLYPLDWITRDEDYNLFISIQDNVYGDTSVSADWKLIVGGGGGGTGSIYSLTANGFANAYTSTNGAITAYADNALYIINPDEANTDTITYEINSLGDLPVKKLVDGVLVNLASGDLSTEGQYILLWRDTYFYLANSVQATNGLQDIQGSIGLGGALNRNTSIGGQFIYSLVISQLSQLALAVETSDSSHTSAIQLFNTGIAQVVSDSSYYKFNPSGVFESPYLTLTTAPDNDDALTQVLVRDSGDGTIKYRDASTFGGGSLTLNQVLTNGNETLGLDILLTEGDRVVVGDNRAGLSKGTFDTSRGGDSGVSLQCAIGYEFNWQAGYLRVMQTSGGGTPLPLYSDSEIIYSSEVVTTPSTGLALVTKDYVDGLAVITIENTTSLFSTGITTYTSTTAENSILLGIEAGQGVTAQKQVAIGYYAGNNATSAYNSVFLGVNAGDGATGANKSNFIGHRAGNNATNANHSTFIGRYVGTNATNANTSVFIGHYAGNGATNASNSIFIGNYAGYGDTVNNSGGSTSIAIGSNSGTGGFQNTIVLGNSATNTKALQFMVGDSYTNWRIGGLEYVLPSSQVGGVLTNDGTGTLTWSAVSGGTVTSVGLSMPSAFSVASSPVTSSGTIAVTGAGATNQYVRGDGSLGTTPASNGGGSSVSYYLNGGTSQGTILGSTYYQASRTAVIGTGVDFSRGTNGLISQFITDANDPALLNIPQGNFNLGFYFSSSSSGGSPSYYMELLKYDGATITTIATNSANPEYITNGTAVDVYYTSLAVPATTLAITDRLIFRVYINASGRTITLHTQDTHLCQIITTFATGMTALNGLTRQVQYFAIGTSGSDFNISSATDTHTVNLPTASASARGALSTADWSTFNGKIGGSGTTNEIGYFTGSGTIASLAVATYPSLTELSYVKGASSNLQNQINAINPVGSKLYLYNNYI